MFYGASRTARILYGALEIDKSLLQAHLELYFVGKCNMILSAVLIFPYFCMFQDLLCSCFICFHLSGCLLDLW